MARRRRRKLSLTDLGVVAKVTVLLCGTRVVVAVLPFSTVQRIVARMARPRSDPPCDAAERRERIIWAARAMGWRLFGDKPCLPQALVVHTYLRRLGFEGTLHIGVAKRDDKLLAHAWVEEAGRVVIGGADSPRRYRPLYRIDPGDIEGR